VPHVFHVRRGILKDHRGGQQDVAQERKIAVHRAVGVANGEAADLDDIVEMLLEKGVSAPRDDDLHLVLLFQEVLDDDLGAGRVSHAFADDAIQDAHARLPPSAPSRDDSWVHSS
jgi:hypothetical protein